MAMGVVTFSLVNSGDHLPSETIEAHRHLVVHAYDVSQSHRASYFGKVSVAFMPPSGRLKS